MNNDKLIKVLLIEDNPGDVRLIQDMLSDLGTVSPIAPKFDLECADRLLTGLERLTKGDIEIVLLDLSLPDSLGLETFDKANAQAPNVPIIVLTVLDDEEVAFEAVHKGAQDYLVKGQVDRNLLSRAIHYAIERKQVEQALQESERRYRTVFESAPVGIGLSSPDGRVLDANDAMCQMTGYSVAELKQINLRDTYHNPEERIPLMERLKTDGFVRDYDVKLKRKNGTVYHATLTITLLTLSGKDVCLTLVEDITERKRAEEELRESEARYRSLIDDVLDSSAVGVSILDSDLKVVWVNQALERYLGLQREKIIGKDKQQLIHKQIKNIFENPEVFAEKVLATCENDNYIESFECHVLADEEREERWLRYWSQSIQSGLYAGGCIEHYTDITELKRAEAQISASLKEKEVLLREIHHRVKNNLQIVSSLLRLQPKEIDGQKYNDILRDSQSRIRSMALVHEKLYQSKDLATVDFSEFIRSLTSYLFQSYGAKGRIALRIDVDKDISLSIDSAIPCGLIINELVSNALKYAFPEEIAMTESLRSKRNEIEIRLRSIDDNEIEVVVGDNGVGIPEDLDFRNTESLGLHLVTVLSERQLHGEIDLDVSEGTKFRITFKE